MMRGDGENGEGRKGMRGREGDERERGWRRRKGNRPIVVITKPTSIVG